MMIKFSLKMFINLQSQVDSLTFRNKQLSARVDSLQQELDSMSKKKVGLLRQEGC